MEIINEFELKKLMELDKENKVVSKIISDEMLKELWDYYNFLSSNVVNLMAKEDKHKIMYSTYYWYTKYKKRYFEVYGYGAGIEQEGVQLLEELENELEDGIDWSIIQKIEEDKK
ncbi:hypothetical protein COE51_20390 [Bacillus pseudomycoides]|nr:hypothetical protein COE51_20390 [Bacillus pseudomycoides]